MKILIDVKNCAECDFAINNVQLHDDPFTSAPLLSLYVCLAKSGPDFIRYEDGRREIHPRCPRKTREDAE